jgi:hypothetical protein
MSDMIVAGAAPGSPAKGVSRANAVWTCPVSEDIIDIETEELRRMNVLDMVVAGILKS